VVALATSYANLCDLVFAPSESIAALLQERGVEVPIAVVPTGVNFERFSGGDGNRFRAAMGLPPGAFVVGHIGRLAPEKNLEFLAEAVATFLKGEPRARFLVAGKGPCEAQIAAILARHNLSERFHHTGNLGFEQLADAYAAMDVFAFASKSETQGIVLTEAMAAGTPVVGLDAAGVREVVHDGENGRLLLVETVETFAGALRWVAALSQADRERVQRACRQTGQAFSLDRCAGKALSQYAQLLSQYSYRHKDESMWTRIVDLIQAEWGILSGEARALGAVIAEQKPDRDTLP
jgi:glycosyltransferase involved in cell wall biosynthesis